MAPENGDDPYITWPPHPDPAVEELFRQANRDGYVIVRLGRVYTLVSPDGTQAIEFPERVVTSSSGIWRLQIYDLQNWLNRTRGEAGGQR